MIELTSIPSDFSAASSPTKFTFRVTKDGKQAYGRKAAHSYIQFSETDYIETGDVVQVNWNDADQNTYVVEFNAVDNPSNINELPGQMSTLDNYTQTVVAVLNNHPSLNPYFFATKSNGLVTLSEKTKADGWSVSFNLNNTQNKNVVVNNESVTADDTPTAFRLEIELYIEKEKGFDYVPITPSLDGDGYTTVDVKGILEEELKRRQLPQPTASTRTPFTYSTGIEYYLRYRENHQNVKSKAWSQTQNFQITKQKFASTDISVENSIISRHQRQIGMQQPEFLSWFNYTNQEVAPYVEANVTYQSGLSSVYKYYNVNYLVSPESVTVFPISLPALGLDGSDVKQYSVRVKTTENDMETTLSQTKSFSPVCDASCTRYLLYRDFSYTLITVKFSGRTAKSLEVDRFDSIRILTGNEEREIFQWDYNFREVFRYRSGYMSRAEVETLEEMLIINEVWEVQGDINLPIHILTKKFKITECFQYLHYIEFDAIVPLLDYLNAPTDGEGIVTNNPLVERYYWNLDDGTDWETNNLQGWEHEGNPESSEI